MWVTRHMDAAGKLWGVVMSGECPWCLMNVKKEPQRHGHWLNPYNGEAYVDVVSAAELGVA